MGKLLSIETGFTCNSRCQYCTQLDYRVIPQADQLDLSTEEIRARILWAKANGRDELGFSGGEPTIRPDFLELVAFAMENGFERIGVTTNGRMFAYPAFAQKALAAGLTRFTFSLHGPTPEMHDRIAAAPGALQQALTGLDNLNAAAKRLGVRLHLMNNQILLPDNTAHIRDMVALLAPKGVRLFMIQPFIAQRSNVADLGRWFVPYADIQAGVEAALPELAKWKARIKPYNVPNCLLTPFGREYVEPQFYEISVFREFEKEGAGEFKPFKARQWYRIDACKTCTEVCPGFRIEQLPQDKMQAAIVEGAQAFAGHAMPVKPLIVGGTELLEPATLAQTLAQLATTHGPLALLTSASERSTRAELAKLVVDATEAGHVAELVLHGRPMDQRFLAQRVLEKGNLEVLRTLLYALAERQDAGAKLPRLRLLLNTADMLRLLDDEVLAGQWPQLVKALLRLGHGAQGTGTPEVVLAVANFARGQQPPDAVRQKSNIQADFQRAIDAIRSAGLTPVLATMRPETRGLDPERGAAMAHIEAHVAELVASEAWDDRFFRHPLADGPMEFVTWLPVWLVERADARAGQAGQGHAEPEHEQAGTLSRRIDNKRPQRRAPGTRWQGKVAKQEQP